MSGWRVASGADEDLSPDQSHSALTATGGPILKLDRSPASHQPVLLASAPWLSTSQDIPACHAPMASMCTHVDRHSIPKEGCLVAGHHSDTDRWVTDGWRGEWEDGQTGGWVASWMDW